jgi:LmbE family N-acetylglucosaminyl deacetylase
MSKIVLVVAPHPDDETLGCGGAILNHISNGDQVHWLIMTQMSMRSGYSSEEISTRQSEINKVAELYGFCAVHQLSFEPAKLDILSMSELVNSTYPLVQSIKPQLLYIPYRGDAHNDHQITFDAITACCKSFRAPFVERILAYETLSETDFSLKTDDTGFKPTVWVDISKFIERKLFIVGVYQSELDEFPFPRSFEAIEAIAKVRGVQCGTKAAEAFILLKEVIR